jgi:flagellar basal body rod protein FlgG
MDTISEIQRVGILSAVTDMNRLSNNIANANSVGYKSVQSEGAGISRSESVIKKTGLDQDFTMIGGHYLSVLDENNISFVKSAELLKDELGFLRTGRGEYLTDQGQRIQLPEGSWKMTSDSEIVVNGEVVATLDVFKSLDLKRLVYLEDGKYQGDFDLANGEGKMMVGFRELSNVNLTSEMLETINVQNRFNSQSVLLKSYSEMIDYSIRTLK